VCDPSAPSIVAQAELSAALQGRAGRLFLDLGAANAEFAAVARHLARGRLSQVEALPAGRLSRVLEKLRWSVPGPHQPRGRCWASAKTPPPGTAATKKDQNEKIDTPARDWLGD
jgi:hypothetical protein